MRKVWLEMNISDKYLLTVGCSSQAHPWGLWADTHSDAVTCSSLLRRLWLFLPSPGMALLPGPLQARELITLYLGPPPSRCTPGWVAAPEEELVCFSRPLARAS